MFNYKKLIRYITLLTSIFLIGFYMNIPLSLVNIFNVLTGRLPITIDNLSMLIFLAFIFISLIIFGRIYCGWICPYGAIQEYISLWQKKSNELNKLSFLKYVFLWIVLMIAFTYDKPTYCVYEPFIPMFTLKGNTLFFSLLIVTLIGAMFFKRYYCKYFCPVGAVLSCCSFFTLKKLKNKTEKCILCKKCVNVCPTNAIKIKPENVVWISLYDCIQCNECIKVCQQKCFIR